MLAFVTVGSTRFDGLIQSVLSSPVLSILRHKGYTKLVIQSGNSDVSLSSSQKDGVWIECWKFRPSLQQEYEKADLVISHAGSGTIIDVLRMGKPLIVVPNPTLLDNHQEELAQALEELGHLKATTTEQLAQTIQDFNPFSLIKFPQADGSQFRNLVDEEMGFI